MTWSQKGIFCDECDTWYHTDCQGIGDGTYDRLSDSKHVWICIKCCLPNYSSSLLESLDSFADSNSFTSLASERLDEASTNLLTDSSDICTPISEKHLSSPSINQPHPTATSTPKSNKPKPQTHRPKAQTKKRLTILNINCRSIRNKIPELHQVIDQTKPDIIACTETWLKPEINSSEIFPENLGYAIYRDDRLSGKGGGTLLAIAKHLTSEDQPDLKSKCNCSWAKITIKGVKSIYVSSFYKPHEGDEQSLLELWQSVKKIPKDSTIWILGDFNMPDIDWTKENIKSSCKFRGIYDDFLENLTNFSLEQVVKLPTREDNILDLFLTNQPGKVHATKTLPSLGSSDHDIVFHEISIQTGRPTQPQRKIKLFGKANWDKFKEDLNSSFEKFNNEDESDPNSLWNTFKAEIDRLTNTHIPSKITRSRSDLPWITHTIRKKIHKRDKLYYKVKSSKGKQNYDKLKSKLAKLKSIIQNEIRKSYWEYLEDVIFSNDSEKFKNKKFYSFVKSKRTENYGIAPLKSEGTTHTDPTDQATVLNQQFESVFSKPKALSLRILSELNLWFQGLNPKNILQMPEISITLNGVENLLKSLNPNKASGPDEISPRLLKELHHEIAPFLLKIFQSSLKTGIVPNDWKSALVAPVYKKGPKSKPSNYRPISLTCISSKLMEHILVSNIMNHFDSNDLLNPFQHGFRSKHSCETQLVSFTQEIVDNLESGKQTDLIIMDFSKAFDKVDHNLLIYKLFNLGVDHKTVFWIQSFLQNRIQSVVVEGKQSPTLPVMSGVPQGSVLGPCLFLAYINDLPDSLKSRTRLFADDTIVYLTINSQSDPEILQNDLHKLEQWESNWSMEFNPDKCEVIRVSRKQNPVIYPYKLHNIELKATESAKYLGVTISHNLSWKPHIETVTSKASNTLKFIKRNIRTNNQKIKATAYNTYVRPQLEYCAQIWHPWQTTLVNQIERVQRAAARYVLNNYDFTCSVTEMLQILNWQTLEHRRLQNSLIFLFKIKYDLVAVDHCHLTESRNHNFLVPQSRTQYHINSYFPRTIRLWNALPYSIKASSSLDEFTAGLATFKF